MEARQFFLELGVLIFFVTVVIAASWFGRAAGWW